MSKVERRSTSRREHMKEFYFKSNENYHESDLHDRAGLEKQNNKCIVRLYGV